MVVPSSVSVKQGRACHRLTSILSIKPFEGPGEASGCRDRGDLVDLISFSILMLIFNSLVWYHDLGNCKTMYRAEVAKLRLECEEQGTSFSYLHYFVA